MDQQYKKDRQRLFEAVSDGTPELLKKATTTFNIQEKQQQRW